LLKIWVSKDKKVIMDVQKAMAGTTCTLPCLDKNYYEKEIHMQEQQEGKYFSI